ncbi:MAG: cupin domain-containing protein [Gammaproteobacteria bacterium]|jgi:mannose-6-phosphate isomerase-like protein (cupin superfamily)
MKRHYVGTVDDKPLQTQERFAAHSEGYRRAELIDHTTSPAAVHMGLGIAELAPGGHLMPVMHAFEKGFYVLGGNVVLAMAGRAHRLGANHYGVIPKATAYSLFNAGGEPVRILEMMAPQPKPLDSGFDDTIFVDDLSLVREAPVPDLSDPRIKHLGYFDETSLTGAGDISGTGVRSSSIYGVSIREFVDRLLGAQHLSMFLVQFQPGGMGTQHDHPHEESYFLLSGKAEAVLDGESWIVEPGHYVWTGVGCFHSFETIGDEPVRWLETQAPLPADFEAFRFRREWEPLSPSR